MATLISYRPSKAPLSRRLNVVMSAATLFLREGISPVRMTDIAEYAGVGVASVYRRFGTKTNLAIAAGTLMWKRFNGGVSDMLTDGRYVTASGAQRLLMLFTHYCDAYERHPDFVRFIDEFDHVVASEQVPPEALEEYGRAVDSFYPYFEEAYRVGVEDGSITRPLDFPLFYRTVAHAMMGIAQKIVRGDIIPSDDYSRGTDELACMVRMVRLTLGMEDED